MCLIKSKEEGLRGKTLLRGGMHRKREETPGEAEKAEVFCLGLKTKKVSRVYPRRTTAGWENLK